MKKYWISMIPSRQSSVIFGLSRESRRHFIILCRRNVSLSIKHANEMNEKNDEPIIPGYFMSNISRLIISTCSGFLLKFFLRCRIRCSTTPDAACHKKCREGIQIFSKSSTLFICIVRVHLGQVKSDTLFLFIFTFFFNLI